MDKEGINIKFRAASNAKYCKVDGIQPNSKPRFLEGDSPEKWRSSCSPRPFNNRSDKNENSFYDLETNLNGDGSEESLFDCFANLAPLESSGLDDLLVFDDSDTVEGFVEKVGVHKYEKAKLALSDSESEEEALQLEAEIKKIRDASVAEERKAKQDDLFSDSEFEFTVNDFKVSKEDDTEQEMTFTDSESEDEGSEPAVDCNSFKIQIQSEKEEMTFTDSGTDMKEELTFTDSESSQGEQPTSDDFVDKASDDPEIEELTFTDSESEEEN